MRVALIDVEALSDGRSNSLVECGPQQFSLLFWPALKQFYGLLPYSREVEEDKLEYWLDREGFTGSVRNYVLKSTVADMLTSLRSQGHDIQLFVTPNVQDLEAAYDDGVQALLTVKPSYGRAEWTPAYDPTPQEWGQLAQRIEDKRLELAADKRVTEVMK